MNNIKGIVFDLDGVIVHTDKFHYLAWKKLADREDIYFDDKINNRLRGVSRENSLKMILENSPKKYSESDFFEMLEYKNNAYKMLLSSLTSDDISREVYDTLVSLKQKGYKLAIGSSSKNAKYILEKVGLIDFFDAISDGTNISKSKPDPEVFLCASKFLGISSNCLAVVEDATSGIDAANSGGFLSVGIGDAFFYPKTKIRIKNFGQLDSIFEQIQ